MVDIVKKLNFKDAGIVIHAPEEIEKQLQALGFKTSLDKKSPNKNVVVFVRNKVEYLSFLKNELKAVESDTVLWIAYPKGTSKIKSDINRDSIRTTGEEFGITTVTAVSIDDIWSALRFRPIERVGT